MTADLSSEGQSKKVIQKHIRNLLDPGPRVMNTLFEGRGSVHYNNWNFCSSFKAKK